jgi:enoyl-CoA hydratase
MTADLLIRINGHIGQISLNKPSTIHALTVDMCRAMSAQLSAWANDPTILAIILDHAASPDGDPKKSRGFCAGGDIRYLRESILNDNGARGLRFYYDEYQLNHQMFRYTKPIVSFWDGIVMGGGAGVALPCKYRVATENTRFAMPETGIGLFPDVGGGWYLPRLAGRMGVFLGLTGARLDGAECIEVGLATHYLPVAALEEAKARIAEHPDQIEGILGALSVTQPDARILRNIERINRLFAADALEDILAALETDGGDWALKELATLRTKAPLSCKVTLRQLADGATCATFEDNMRMEYRIVAHILTRHDFAEGVRAVIVDKDNAPVWNPATPEAVSDALIDEIFAPLTEDEEWQPLH